MTSNAPTLRRATNEPDEPRRTGVFVPAKVRLNFAATSLSQSGTIHFSTDYPQWVDVVVEKYAKEAISLVETRKLDGEWIAEIPGLNDLWADGDTRQEAIDHMEIVLLDWLWLKIEDHDGDIPLMGGIDLNSL